MQGGPGSSGRAIKSPGALCSGVTGDLLVQTNRLQLRLSPPSLALCTAGPSSSPHRDPKGPCHRGEPPKAGTRRPPRPGLLRDLRRAPGLRCYAHFDPGITSSRAFVTLGGAVPHGNSGGPSGMGLKGLSGATSAASGSCDAQGPLGAPLRPPVSPSPARPSAPARFRPPPGRRPLRLRASRGQTAEQSFEEGLAMPGPGGKAQGRSGHSPSAAPQLGLRVSDSLRTAAERASGRTAGSAHAARGGAIRPRPQTPGGEREAPGRAASAFQGSFGSGDVNRRGRKLSAKSQLLVDGE